MFQNLPEDEVAGIMMSLCQTYGFEFRSDCPAVPYGVKQRWLIFHRGSFLVIRGPSAGDLKRLIGHMPTAFHNLLGDEYEDLPIYDPKFVPFVMAALDATLTDYPV